MADARDIAFGEIAIHMGYLTPEQLQECLSLQAASNGSVRLGDLLVNRGLISEEQRARIARQQEKLLREIRMEDRLRKEAEMFARFALQKGMINEGQYREALVLFDRNTDASKTMARIMIEAGMLSEEQVTALSMAQKQIKMICYNCRLKYTVVTLTQKADVRCPKCKGPLRPAPPTETTTRLSMRGKPSRPQLQTQVFRVVKQTREAARTKRMKKAACVICGHEFMGELDKDDRTTCPECGTSFEVL